MLETCTVSGFNTASILSLGHLQINVKLHLSGNPIRDPWNRHQPLTVHFSHPYSHNTTAFALQAPVQEHRVVQHRAMVHQVRPAQPAVLAQRLPGLV